jgi:hypothetical protein
LDRVFDLGKLAGAMCIGALSPLNARSKAPS